MSEVWPPPPEDQPNRTASAPSQRHRFAIIVSSGLFYSCLGALMLVSPVLIAVGHSFSRLHFFANTGLFFGKLSLLGLIVIIVGGTLGYRHRSTANGLKALIISSVALCLQFGLVLRGFF